MATSLSWLIVYGFFIGLFAWVVVANRQRARKARQRRREPVTMQTIIAEKPKCYGDFFQVKTSCDKCQHLKDCAKVGYNLLLALGLDNKIQYNYPELKQTYDQY